ncbi:MAG: hypothetical protein GEU90_22475, partial [Gemmatimonas sp.]|nr:hypothetical protein [Gemmatimonas sp.]
MLPMRWLSRSGRALWQRNRMEREMDEEMRLHLEMEIEDRVRAGMSPREARRTALRDFGGIERFKEEAREIRGIGAIEDLRQDARFTVRTLRKNPGFALVAVLTLALGIGANTAVFSVVDGTLLRPLPYPEADRVVRVQELDGNGSPMPVTGGNFEDWREMSRSFEAIAVYTPPEFTPMMTVLGANEAVRTRATWVTADFWRVMGVAPALGRSFVTEETLPGGASVMLVSDSFWRTHLGGDMDVLGRVLDLGGEPHEIVGVMPAGFGYPAATAVWMPHQEVYPGRMGHNYDAVGRLKAGIDPAEAQRELSLV